MSAANWKLFGSTFALIFLAELPDKTAFANFFLAANNSPLGVFLGGCAAFVVQSFIAVCFGSLFGLLPSRLIHFAAGILFLIFALMMWREREKNEEESAAEPDRSQKSFMKVVVSSFMVIFIAEWGDLTQLATATLAAKYRQFPVTLFAASTSALWLVTGISAFAGHHAKKLIRPRLLQTAACAVFAAAGVYLLISR